MLEAYALQAMFHRQTTAEEVFVSEVWEFSMNFRWVKTEM